jgi:oligopeptide/dipeptide ABC transporter ATP-binding protein
VSLDVGAGETLGVVGESGSGKTMTVLAALGLVPEPCRVTGGLVQFQGRDVTGFGEREWQPIRGNDIGVIFQDPVAALNPALTVGAQVGEPLMLHRHLGRRQARRRAVELLGMVQLPDPARTLDLYPHQLSGGMAQRVGIAIALACEPALLIADEPTTALDVTVQGQILDLLDDLTSGLGMSTVLITHDLGVIAETADRVAVLYAGQVVEVGTPHQLFSEPRHPYTWSLLATMPQNHRVGDQLTVITGTPPTPAAWPAGCRFHPRCPFTTSTCRRDPPPPHTDLGDGRSSRCHRLDDLTAPRNPPAPPTATNPAAAPRSQP